MSASLDTDATVTSPGSREAPSRDSFDPAERLLMFLRGALGGDVRYVESPTSFGQGFDTMIYWFRIEGRGVRGAWAEPLVLRVYTTPEQDEKARREAAVQRFVSERGYPALVPLAVETSDGLLGLPFMILPRMPGGMLLARMSRRPWQAAHMMSEMGRLHAELHRLPHEGAPLGDTRAISGERHAGLLRLMVGASRITGVDDALDWLARHAGSVRSDELALLHGDFHPLNVLLADDGSMRVIDWSDATIGDRHADVARPTALLWFAQVAAESAVERTVLKLVRGRLQRWYRGGYARVLPLDARRLTYWEAAQALRGMVQVAEVHAHNDEAPIQRLPPRLIPALRAYFETKAAAFEAMPVED